MCYTWDKRTATGTACELTFARDCVLNGINYSVPAIDNGVDHVTINQKGRTWKVQVKAATIKDKSNPNCNCYCIGAKRKYTPQEIDFLVAVTVHPRWPIYIIPIKVWNRIKTKGNAYNFTIDKERPPLLNCYQRWDFLQRTEPLSKSERSELYK